MAQDLFSEMAAARQIIELLRSHVEGDDERFRTAALQMAANEARQGHNEFAEEIQKLLASASYELKEQSKQISNAIPFFRAPGELAGLLDVVNPTVGLNNLVLSTELQRRLRRIIKEQSHFGQLREHGLRARQRLLLLGPPGCGKTITAHALAHELGLPLCVVRLDAIFTKFLGETANKLRLVFDAVEKHRAVFLFDEFDSVGLSRGSEHDVGEMRRILNSFLVFIDNMSSHSVVVAASNHPEVLDPALFRRFDEIIEYSMPTPKEIEEVIRCRLATEKTKGIDWLRIVRAASNLSFAEASRMADDAVKERILERKPYLTTDLLLSAIADRKKATPRRRRKK
jgi:SpoVK/Ycf46/Vps4 family AAA+-type ATPase